MPYVKRPFKQKRTSSVSIDKKTGTKLGPEEQLQAACVDWLRVACPDVIYHHSPNGAYLGRGAGRFAYIEKLKRLGMRGGFPDLLLIWGGGNSLFVELKVKGNTQSENQIAFMNGLRERGHNYEVAYTLDEFIALCNLHGVHNRCIM